MKIVMIITGLSMGGAETQVCNLANSLSNLNHDVSIISLSDSQGVLPNNSVKVFNINMEKTIPGFLKAYFKSRRIIKELKPDVVHSHMVHANIFARLLRIITPIPRLISTMHNTNEGGRIRMLAYRLTDRLADLSTNVSKEGVEAFIKLKAVNKNRIICMYNGIDTNKFAFSLTNRSRFRAALQIDDNTHLIMAIGRLTEAKDYPNLLKAFAKFDAAANVKLAIIGDGPLKDELVALAEKLGVNDNIYWLGIQDNVSEWLSACDTFVLSSEWEGFGLVVAEAMACGRVVVATDSGGVKEVMGATDFIVPVKDSDTLWQKIALSQKLSDEKKDWLFERNRTHIQENFSLKSITERWLSVYKNNLEKLL